MSKDCLDDNFPGVKLTELQILPTGADGTAPTGQCLPCTKANAQTTDANTGATYCDPAASFFAFDYADVISKMLGNYYWDFAVSKSVYIYFHSREEVRLELDSS